MIDRAAAVLCALFVLSCAAPEAEDVAVEVVGVQADAANNLVLLLEESDGERVLPIWIGMAEAQSIAAHLEQIEFPRPNTHLHEVNAYSPLWLSWCGSLGQRDTQA